jgi:hypothetical protein
VQYEGLARSSPEKKKYKNIYLAAFPDGTVRESWPVHYLFCDYNPESQRIGERKF